MTLTTDITTLPVLRNGGQHHLTPTKRGWLFLGKNGGPCDKACKMCYYTFQSNLIFYTPDTLKAHANLFRHHYGLEYCDISGGEATIYGPKKDGRRPQLEELVSHCARIGLKPTIITHGQNNTAELVKGIEDAGLEDWLISIHGLSTGHDATVVDHSGKGRGGWGRLVAGLAHCTRPVRFNTTVQNFNFAELPGLAQWLVDSRPASVWNIIQFNPFFAWNDPERQDIDFQSTMTEIAPYIGRAVQTAEEAGWEVNVRYFPFCVAAPYGFAKNCVNFYGTQYDHWEWCLAATNRMGAAQINQLGGLEAARRAYCDAIGKDRSNPACAACRFNQICEGPSNQYLARYGFGELTPAPGETVRDIQYFEKGGQFA